MIIFLTSATATAVQRRYVNALCDNDVIVLKEDGVYQYSQLKHLSVKVYDIDAETRGISVCEQHRLSISQWVTLHDKHQHWVVL